MAKRCLGWGVGLAFLLALWSFSLLPALETAHAQTSTEASEPTKQEADEAEKAEVKPIDQLAEIIVGAWSTVSKTIEGNLTPKMLETALAKCFQPMTTERLRIQPGAEKKLPPPSQFVGTVSYYKTEKGLQRFDSAKGTLFLLSEAEKKETESGRVIWRMTGGPVNLQVTFATKEAPKRKLVLMIEGKELLLKCPTAVQEKTDDQG